MADQEVLDDYAPAVAPAKIEHLDVLIVGAGLSGIGAACHLQKRCKGLTYALLESRSTIGGTWDLFRYPGIRSDSDMFTLGYSFRPWSEAKSIASGASILNYVRETADDFAVSPRIRFNHRVRRASWSSAAARWTVEAERTDTGEPVRLTCGFLLMCSGYYDYAGGHMPEFAHSDLFRGQIVHPQFWPQDLDYAGKRVVVVGSGATAVTIVPEMAKTAAHVTMLQRSPTYIVARPSEDKAANWLRARLPAKLAYRLTRAKNMALGMYFYNIARKKPEETKQQIIAMARHLLGPEYDVDTHFTPTYKPWDQRLCLVPDADLFHAIRDSRASIATGHIEAFTQGGVRLRSGDELEADIVVMATGLKVNLLGDVKLTVDGEQVDLSKALAYKGSMFSGVPNLASVIGYTNASWTLKADITCEYVCRLLNLMRRRHYAAAVPRRGPAIEEEPFFNLTSGYVQRAIGMMPKQGSKRPWRMHRNYAMDALALRYGRVADGTMEFVKQ